MVNPTQIPTELLIRLACLFEPYQLEDIVYACEMAKQAGDGWYMVEIECKPGNVDVRGRFTRKPRRDQSDLLRR